MRFLLLVPFIVMLVYILVKEVQFNQNCGGYINRAAHANTIEMAAGELDIVINYLESHNMTSGYTSILYNTPDEDVGFWYKNIKESRKELATITPDASQLERSNVLLKLRETLQGNVLSGISLFPNNLIIAFIFVFCCMFGFVGLFLIIED